MSLHHLIKPLIVLMFALWAAKAMAQMMPNPYGEPIRLETAKKVAAPALAEAAKNNWTVAVAIVDPAGILDRCLRRHFPARWPMRQGGRGCAEVVRLGYRNA